MAQTWAKAFYNSASWKYTRKAVLKRDCFSCAWCGTRAEEVHHIKELTAENINDINITLNPDNLISLCGECHKKVTKGSVDCKQDYYFDENGQLVRHIPPASLDTKT